MYILLVSSVGSVDTKYDEKVISNFISMNPASGFLLRISSFRSYNFISRIRRNWEFGLLVHQIIVRCPLAHMARSVDRARVIGPMKMIEYCAMDEIVCKCFAGTRDFVALIFKCAPRIFTINAHDCEQNDTQNRTYRWEIGGSMEHWHAGKQQRRGLQRIKWGGMQSSETFKCD